MPQAINFSIAASIGIHSLIVLAREKKPLNAIQLAEKIGSSKYNIGKVLQRLVKDGLLTSLRGPTGGFNLKKDPSQIYIYDVYRSIEGEIELGECPNQNRVCPLDMCIRDTIIKPISTQFIDILKSSTIQDYI